MPKVRRLCGVAECQEYEFRLGFCTLHHQELKRSGWAGDLRKPCSVEDCPLPARAKGLCERHNYLMKTHGSTADRPFGPPKTNFLCTVPGCGRAAKAKGMCPCHYYRVQHHGDPGSAERRTASPGSGHICKRGYRTIYRPGHPNAGKNGNILEHTYVMSQILGRPLLPDENVHHKNGTRHDNRPENLELWMKSQPSGQRVEDRIVDALALLATYLDQPHLWPEELKEQLSHA